MNVVLHSALQDFDIAGNYDPMVADAEILRIVCEALTALDLGKYTIKVRLKIPHLIFLELLYGRKILYIQSNRIFTLYRSTTARSSTVFSRFAVFPPTRSAPSPLPSTSSTRYIPLTLPLFSFFSFLCSIPDSLGPAQLPWEDVRKEMTEEKGLAPASADAIGEYVKLKGGRDLLERLVTDSKLSENENTKKGLEDMELLFTYLEVLGVMDKVGVARLKFVYI